MKTVNESRWLFSQWSNGRGIYSMQWTVYGSVFGTVCDFFVCVSNISWTAEWIYAKFTRKMSLVPCSDEFECQGQRSRSLEIKNGVFSGYLGNHWTDLGHTQKTCLVPHLNDFEGRSIFGGLHAVYVRKTSLLLFDHFLYFYVIICYL